MLCGEVKDSWIPHHVTALENIVDSEKTDNKTQRGDMVFKSDMTPDKSQYCACNTTYHNRLWRVALNVKKSLLYYIYFFNIFHLLLLLWKQLFKINFFLNISH